MTSVGFGIIPIWQMSGDPAVNIKLNPHVQYPPGMTQMTVQPVVGDINNWPPQISARTWPNDNLQGPFDMGFFDSWWWRNRKWVLLGGIGLAAFGAFSLLR